MNKSTPLGSLVLTLKIRRELLLARLESLVLARRISREKADELIARLK